VNKLVTDSRNKMLERGKIKRRYLSLVGLGNPKSKKVKKLD
jgi:hypothetical protein